MQHFGAPDRDVDRLILYAMFTTLTNVDFNPPRFTLLLHDAAQTRDRVKAACEALAQSRGVALQAPSGPAEWQPAATLPGLLEQAAQALPGFRETAPRRMPFASFTLVATRTRSSPASTKIDEIPPCPRPTDRARDDNAPDSRAFSKTRARLLRGFFRSNHARVSKLPFRVAWRIEDLPPGTPHERDVLRDARPSAGSKK